LVAKNYGGVMKRKINLNSISLTAIIVLPFILYAKVLFSGKMLFGTDWISGEYMQREFFVRCLHDNGIFALWNPLKFAGIPTGEGFFGDIFYPVTLLLKTFLPLFVVWTLEFVIHPVIAGLGTYFYTRKKTGKELISLFASISYMFTGVLISEVYGGHDGRVIVMSYLPFLIFFLDRGLSSEKLFNFLLASIASGMMFLSGHIQSSYYAVVFGIFYVVYMFIENNYSSRFKNGSWIIGIILGALLSIFSKYLGFAFFVLTVFFLPAILDRKFSKKSLKIYGYLILFVIFTFGLSAVQYIPVMRFLPDAARGTIRDYTYATSWSMGFPDIIDMFFSGFSGINFQNINNYWGENAFKLHTGYLGLFPILFAVCAMFSKKRSSLLNFFTISAITVLILALVKNTPLYRIFYSLFIYVDKFRAPELIFFIFAFSASILASLFLSNLTDKKTFSIVSIVYASFGLILLLFPNVIIDVFSPLVKNFGPGSAQKLSNLSSSINGLKGSVLLNLILLALAFYSLYFVSEKHRNLVFIILVLITVFDLWSKVAKFVVPIENPKEYYAEDEVVGFLQKDPETFRVFPFSYRDDDYLNLYDIQIVSGNHPSPFSDYQIFIGNSGSVMFNPMNFISAPNRIKVLNVKYMVSPLIPSDTAGYDLKSQSIIEQYNLLFENLNFKRVFLGSKYMVLQSNNYLPRVFMVNKYTIASSLDSALKIIDSGAVDLHKTVILTDEPKFKLSEADSFYYTVNSLKYTPNFIEINVTSSSKGFLVLLDQYYKAWKCEVNGRKTDIMKADGIFRAVPLEQGENSVKFFFDASLMLFSAAISLLSLIIIIAVYFIQRRTGKRMINKNG
jgi:hypothetical protein